MQLINEKDVENLKKLNFDSKFEKLINDKIKYVLIDVKRINKYFNSNKSNQVFLNKINYEMMLHLYRQYKLTYEYILINNLSYSSISKLLNDVINIELFMINIMNNKENKPFYQCQKYPINNDYYEVIKEFHSLNEVIIYALNKNYDYKNLLILVQIYMSFDNLKYSLEEIDDDNLKKNPLYLIKRKESNSNLFTTKQLIGIQKNWLNDMQQEDDLTNDDDIINSLIDINRIVRKRKRRDE